MYSKAQRLISEGLGTAALVLVGPGSVVATLKLAGKVAPFTEADLLGISFAFGFIITALVYALGKVSGCHINPAVTLALAATRRFPWREVPMYWGAQFLGGIAGGLAIWGIYAKAAIDLGMGQASFNPDVTSYAGAALTEFLGTALLMLAILGIVDRRAPADLAGIVIGGFVVGIIMVLGPITSCAINPARALGPEVVSALGGGVTNWAQFVPAYLIPELVGAVAAALLYDFLAEPRLRVRTVTDEVTSASVAGEMVEAAATAAAR
jgi:glycerol uptake facilitator protein